MGIISKIGPLELSLIFFFGVLLLYRIQAASESRAATALVFIFSARFGSSFIAGFSISESTKSLLGELDTVFSYLMLAFALLEVLLLKHATNWKSSDLWVLVGLLGIGFLNLAWKLTYKGGIIANDLLYVIPILLLLSLRPKKIDLRFLPYFGATIIVMVLITALTGYQNPLVVYFQTDYGLGGPYQNRVWSFFGFEERFRGPYFHPNQLGIQVTFLSLLVLLKPSKLYFVILPISFTLLFLASSRTSILALTVGLFLRIYFDITMDAELRSSHSEKDFLKGNSTRGLTPKKLFFGLTTACGIAVILRQIIGLNYTASGRLENNRVIISAIRDNLLLGQGPSLFSINNTENTILTLLSFYGLIGFAFLLPIALAFIIKFIKMTHIEKNPFIIVLVTFLIAGLAEALLTASSQDTGLYYLLVLLILSREVQSSKDRLRNGP